MPRHAPTLAVLAVAFATASSAVAQIGDSPAQLWEQVSAGTPLSQ